MKSSEPVASILVYSRSSVFPTLAFMKYIEAIESGDARALYNARRQLRDHGFIAIKLLSGFQPCHSFGERLWAARGSREPKKFARSIGISRRQLQNLENHLTQPSLELLKRVCHVTGNSAEWFLFGQMTNRKDVMVCHRKGTE